jgi:homoserine kinase type II
VSAPDLDRVLDLWRLPRPRAFTPAGGGYQNTTLLVRCAAGDFVLKVHSNLADRTSRRFEHDLLRRLAACELPFAVPNPLPGADGDTLQSAGGRPAALFAWIDGEALPKDGGSYLPQAAQALARLDVALAPLDRFAHRPPSFDGDLRRVHPLVDDLAAAMDDSGLEPDRRRLLRLALERAAELAAPAYASLPQQVTHGDFAFGNTLVRDGRVAGVVDFEHAGIDVRAMELATAFYRFPAHPDAVGECERFGRAYCAVLPLDLTELAALPALLRLRAGVSVLHWVGRYRARLATLDDVRARAERALFTCEWVDANGEELARRALGWIGERS